MNFEKIQIDKLIPNDWNPNHIKKAAADKLKRFIQAQGDVLPLVVRNHPDKKGCYQIIDGFHRWQIFKELAYAEVDCVVIEATDDQAKILTVNLNYLRGQAKPIEYAKLIHDLTELHSLEDLELVLPESKPQLLDKLELLQLPSDVKRELEQKSGEQEKESLTTISFQVTSEQKGIIETALDAVDRKKKGTALTDLVKAGLEIISSAPPAPDDSSLST
jgi:ParB/RepB/Spo0J family partition protein